MPSITDAVFRGLTIRHMSPNCQVHKRSPTIAHIVHYKDYKDEAILKKLGIMELYVVTGTRLLSEDEKRFLSIKNPLTRTATTSVIIIATTNTIRTTVRGRST